MSTPSSFVPSPGEEPPVLLVSRDEEHVRLLAGYHLVIAGFHTVALILFVLLPLLIGPAFYRALGAPPPPNPLLWQQMLLVNLLVRGLLTFLIALNGWSLKRRRHWLTCVLLSIFECSALILLHDPLSFLLGVSAILVLRRPGVKEMFNRTSHPSHSA
jgi:hypothetical protein